MAAARPRAWNGAPPRPISAPHRFEGLMDNWKITVPPALLALALVAYGVLAAYV
jgi:hypothetical protein